MTSFELKERLEKAVQTVEKRKATIERHYIRTQGMRWSKTDSITTV